MLYYKSPGRTQVVEKETGDLFDDYFEDLFQ